MKRGKCCRKLAHEIKNPLTQFNSQSITLEKFKDKLPSENKDFEKYLETINKQIKDIQ